MFRSPLYRHGNFLRLWVAQTVSLFGAQITTLALPTVAIILLHASPFEVGALAAMPWLAYVSVGLIAGVIADQLPRRPLMVTADLARALALGTVPLAFAFGVLSLAHLYLVAAAVGVCNVFFDVSYQSYLPTLLERDQLLEGNAKLVFGQAAALTGGPAIGGLLIGAVGGALAIIANAFSFLFSAICLGAITKKEEAPSREPKLHLNTGIAEIVSGIRFVMRQPVIRTLTSVSAIQNFGEFMADPMLLIFMYVELHLSPSIVGLTVAIGSAGFLLGAALAARMTSKIGIGPMLAVSSLLGGMAFLVLPLGQLGFPILWVVLWRLLFGLHVPTYNVNVLSIRQMIVPDRLQGRVNATNRIIANSVGVLAPLLGGVLGNIWGPAPTIFLGGVVFLLGSTPVLTRSVIKLRDYVTTATV